MKLKMKSILQNPNSFLGFAVNAVERYFYVLVFVVFLILNIGFYGLTYPSDEWGYLSKAILFSGQEIVWPSQWFAGYSLLLSPLLYASMPLTFWHYLVFFQTLLCGGIFYMLRSFLLFLNPGLSSLQRFAILTLCAFYPSYIIMCGFAFTSIVFTFLYLLILYLLLNNRNDWWQFICLGGIAGFLFWIHPIGIGVTGACAAAILSRPDKKWKNKLVSFSLFVFVSIVFVCFYLFMIYPYVDGKMSDAISKGSFYGNSLTHFDIRNFLLNMGGQTAYIVIGSLGIAAVGLYKSAQEALSRIFRKIKTEYSILNRSDLFLYILLSFLAMLLIGSFNFATNKDFSWNMEAYLYGRFNETVLLPLLVIGLTAKWQRRHFLLSILLLSFLFIAMIPCEKFSYQPLNAFALWPLYIFLKMYGYNSHNIMRSIPVIAGIAVIPIVFTAFLARKSYIHIVVGFLLGFLWLGCIYAGLEWHEIKQTHRCKPAYSIAKSLNTIPLDKVVFWDSLAQRQNEPIGWMLTTMPT